VFEQAFRFSLFALLLAHPRTPAKTLAPAGPNLARRLLLPPHFNSSTTRTVVQQSYSYSENEVFKLFSKVISYSWHFSAVSFSVSFDF
jgi:hypothetical protein